MLSKQELLGCISQKHSQLWSQVLLNCIVNHSWLRETHPRFHQLQKDRVIVSARSDLKTNLVDYAEPDFTKCNMFLDRHFCWSWNNIPINQSDL